MKIFFNNPDMVRNMRWGISEHSLRLPHLSFFLSFCLSVCLSVFPQIILALFCSRCQFIGEGRARGSADSLSHSLTAEAEEEDFLVMMAENVRQYFKVGNCHRIYAHACIQERTSSVDPYGKAVALTAWKKEKEEEKCLSVWRDGEREREFRIWRNSGRAKYIRDRQAGKQDVKDSGQETSVKSERNVSAFWCCLSLSLSLSLSLNFAAKK